jgi:hypothetical protein
MASIELIAKQLKDGCDINIVRSEICDLLSYHLTRSKVSNNFEALAHFTNAVGSLTLNINLAKESKAGLGVCLIDLEKAIAALEQPSEPWLAQARPAELVTYGMLLGAVRVMQAKAEEEIESKEGAA